MNKRKIALIASCFSLVGAMVVTSSVCTWAYFEQTKVLQNDDGEDLRVETDQIYYRNVTFTVRAKPELARCSVYLYDKVAKKSVLMTATDDTRQVFTVDYLVKTGTFEYRYFIANTSNPDNDVTVERNNVSSYREATITDTSSAQSDKWITQVNFKIHYDTEGKGSMKVASPFGGSVWRQENMYHLGNNDWNLSIEFEQYIDSVGEAYDYKYVNGIGNWESGNNRNLWSTIGNYTCYARAYLDCNDSWRA